MHCSTKKQEMMMQVLNGIYPSEISKMNKFYLERFVEELVKRTSMTSCRGDKINLAKPKWWPKDIAFNKKRQYPKDGVFYIRPILKLLVVKCSEYFRNSTFKQKWLPDLSCDDYYQKGENDENSLAVINSANKRKLTDFNSVIPAKKLKLNVTKPKSDLPPVEVNECFEGAHEPVEPNFVLIPNQEQFLQYFALQSHNLPPIYSQLPLQTSSALKLANCPHIPFSSDIGKLMISNENHTMPEELKLRRLEKTEWYLSGKSLLKHKEQQEYEVTYVEKSNGTTTTHNYQIPKRQSHQHQVPLYCTPFIMKHLQSAYIKLERLDISLIERKLKVCVRRVPMKELSPYICKEMKDVRVVVIRGELSEPDSNNAIRRYSPRLRSL